MAYTWILQTRLRAWLAFALLAGLLLLAAMSVVQQQLRYDLAGTQQEAQRELKSLGSLVSEALRRGHYQSLDTLLRDWGVSNPELSELQVIGQNGFVLSTYQRSAAPTKPLNLTLPIDYSYRGHATLNLTRDLADVYASNTVLRNQLLSLILIVGALLGVVLFLLLKRQEEADVLGRRTQAFQQQKQHHTQ